MDWWEQYGKFAEADPMTDMAEAAKAGITVDEYRARRAREQRRRAAMRARIEATHAMFADTIEPAPDPEGEDDPDA